MRKLIKCSALTLLFAGLAAYGAGETRFKDIIVNGSQSIGDSTAANSKAVLDVKSTTKSLLPPRMTTTQKNAISSPPASSFLYDSTLNYPFYYNGTSWFGIASLDRSETLTNKTISGASNTLSGINYSSLSLSDSIVNADINSAAAIVDTKLATISTAGKVSNSATTATAANTASAIMARDGSGQVAATTFTGALAGNATTATSATSASTAADLSATLSIAHGGTAVTSVTTAPTPSNFAGWDASKNLSANNHVSGYATTATAATTTTLTVASAFNQYFTGSTTQTVKMPDATTLPMTGFAFRVVNLSSGIVSAVDAGSNAITSIAGGSSALITAKSIATSNGSWDATSSSGGGGGVSAWAASTAYTAGNLVTYGGQVFTCLANNTSGSTIEADIALGYWKQINTQTNAPNLMLAGTDFENNTVGGWTAVGCATITNGLPACNGSGAAAFSSSNGGRAKGGNTTAPAIVSSGQLSGSYSLNLATSGAGTIGDMYISQPFSISISQQAKVLSFKFNYKNVTGAPVLSGTSANTYAIGVYDIANNTWLGIAGQFNIVQGTGVGVATGTFQTNSNSTSLQLAVYSPVAPVGASAFYLDDFYVGPQITASGPAISDWVAYTPAFVGFGTPSAVNFRSRQVGDTLEVQGTFTTGTSTAVTASISLGYNGVNGGVVTSSVGTQNSGYWTSAVIGQGGAVFTATGSSVVTFGLVDASTAGWSTDILGSTIGTGKTVTLFFSSRISGWSSNSQRSSDVIWADDVGQIAAFGTSTTPEGFLPADGAAVSRAAYSQLFAKIGTAYGAGDASTTFNVPDMRGLFPKGAGTTNRAAGKDSSGNYYAGTLGTYSTDKFQGHHHQYYAGNTGGGSWNISGYAGSISQSQALAGLANPDQVSDAISDGTNGTPRVGHTTEPQSLGLQYYIRYSRTAAPVVTISEPVAMYTYGSSTSLSTGYTTLIPTTVVKDTHGAMGVGSGIFTAPISSFYSFGGSIMSSTSLTFLQLYYSVDAGADYGLSSIIVPSATTYLMSNGSNMIYLKAGQTLAIKGRASTTCTGDAGVYTYIYAVK